MVEIFEGLVPSIGQREVRLSKRKTLLLEFWTHGNLIEILEGLARNIGQREFRPKTLRICSELRTNENLVEILEDLAGI